MNTKKPVGNGVEAPVYKTGTTVIIPGGDKSISYSDGKGDTATGPNLSAKWKGGAQSIPEAGRNQYE
jgi:hypothetical protein